MSVKFICGSTYSEVRAELARELEKKLSLDSKNFVIVPDSATITAKKEFLRLLDTKSTFNLKVLGFFDLVKQFLSAQQTISKEQAILIFKWVCKKNKHKLKSFDKIAEKDNSVRAVFSLINNLAESDISPAKLLEAGQNIGGILGAKTEDIAVLYGAFYDEICGKFADSHILMKMLSEKFACGDLGEEYNFYLCDFGIMTAEQLSVLKSLAMSGANLIIGSVANENSDNKRIYPRFLKDFCNNLTNNTKLDVQKILAKQTLSKDKKLPAEYLYGFDEKVKFDGSSSISLHCAENVSLEVRGICREIRKLVVGDGVRYKDINIFCPDIDLYKRDIAREFENFEIPYFMQVKQNLSDFAVAKLLIDGVNLLKSNFDRANMLAFCKNYLLDIGEYEKNIFELFVTKYNLDGKQFLADFDKKYSEPMYEIANNVRGKLVDIVLCLVGDDFSSAVQNFYGKIFENKSYDEYLSRVLAIEGETARRNAEIAQNKIFEIVQAVQDVCKNAKLTIPEHDCILDIVKNAKIGACKQYVDNVFITSDTKQINSAKVLFVIGANDGTLVKESSTIGLFTYGELESLSVCGIDFCPNIMDINYNQKFEAVQLLTKGDRVFVTYPEAQGEPSLLVKNTSNLLGLKISPLVADVNKIGMDFAKYATKIGTKTNAKQELSLYYSERMRGIATGEQKVFDYLYTKLDGEYKYQNIIKQKDFKYTRANTLGWSKKGDITFASISSLERYFDCPFKFYCEKTIKLKKPQTGVLDTMTSGSFVHRILEKFFKRYKNFDMEQDEINSIATKLCEETIAEKDFEAIGLAYSKSVLEGSLFKKVAYILNKLTPIARRSDFEVAHTELTFGFDYSKLPAYEIKSGGKSYYIRGKIDRIDKFGDYFAVVDYKSSSSVSYSLKEIFYGERVQLLIYLNAYMVSNKLKPVALLYMPLPYSYNKEDSSGEYSYCGLVRNLEDAISLFDKDYQDKNICALPLSYKRNGEIDFDKTLTEQDLKILTEYADKVVAQAISEIESGYIEAKPTNCDNCEYGQICLSRYDTSKTRNKYSKTHFSIKAEQEVDESVVEQEESNEIKTLYTKNVVESSDAEQEESGEIKTLYTKQILGSDEVE